MISTVKPRVFIGMLYSGEAEFLTACQAINQQENVTIEHEIIRNLPELQAHQVLWDKWNAVKHLFDLFIKIDADTILINKHAVYDIYQLFAADSEVTGAQILLHDYYTDRLIAGLNCFTKDVVFRQTKNHLLCDRVDTNHKKVLKGSAVEHLAPIGYHCQNPHPVQAFRFGFHRALKKQHQTLSQLAHAWLKHEDDARMWALAGAMSVSMWNKRFHNYTDAKFQTLFERFKTELNKVTKIKKFAQQII
ncbi:MAG: hypothetical protein Tsb005_05020 [Gammaproteobacteria bacterium]